MDEKIKEKIKEKSIPLEEYGLNDLAWEKKDAQDLINLIMQDNIGILGGDVYKIYLKVIIPIGDNWLCEQKCYEPQNKYYLRSKVQSLNYIKDYTIRKNEKLVFSITFTEYMT